MNGLIFMGSISVGKGLPFVPWESVMGMKVQLVNCWDVDFDLTPGAMISSGNDELLMQMGEQVFSHVYSRGYLGGGFRYFF